MLTTTKKWLLSFLGKQSGESFMKQQPISSSQHEVRKRILSKLYYGTHVHLATLLAIFPPYTPEEVMSILNEMQRDAVVRIEPSGFNDLYVSLTQ